MSSLADAVQDIGLWFTVAAVIGLVMRAADRMTGQR
jgi:hypothetical protein